METNNTNFKKKSRKVYYRVSEMEWEITSYEPK